MPASPKVYLRSYPVTDGMEAHAYAVEEDGWDGMLFTPTQILSMEVFGSLYLAASAISRLELGTAVTNLVTRHPAVMASSPAIRRSWPRRLRPCITFREDAHTSA